MGALGPSPSRSPRSPRSPASAAWSEPARFVYELILEDPWTAQRLGGAYGAVAACPGQLAVVHDELVLVLDPNTTGGVLRLVGRLEDPSSGARLFEPGPILNTVRLSPRHRRSANRRARGRALV